AAPRSSTAPRSSSSSPRATFSRSSRSSLADVTRGSRLAAPLAVSGHALDACRHDHCVPLLLAQTAPHPIGFVGVERVLSACLQHRAPGADLLRCFSATTARAAPLA